MTKAEAIDTRRYDSQAYFCGNTRRLGKNLSADWTTTHVMPEYARVIQFLRENGNQVLHTEQWLPVPRQELFEFFADAFQLERITPPWLHFHVLTARPITMAVGLKIDYRLRLHRVPIGWQSEISAWEPPSMFVDRQLRGPYRLWHHQHTFIERDGGTLVVDRIDYRVPGGRLINRWLVEPDLRRIFEFRRETLAAIFAGRAPASIRLSAAVTDPLR